MRRLSIPAGGGRRPPWLAGAAYGLTLLAGGWILGPLRLLLVVPRVGPFVAVWLEAPLMMVVMALTVHALRRAGWIGDRPRERLGMGLTGAGLVLLGEAAGALLIGGGGRALAAFGTPAGLSGLALLGVAALAPLALLRWPRARARLR